MGPGLFLAGSLWLLGTNSLSGDKAEAGRMWIWSKDQASGIS